MSSARRKLTRAAERAGWLVPPDPIAENCKWLKNVIGIPITPSDYWAYTWAWFATLPEEDGRLGDKAEWHLMMWRLMGVGGLATRRMEQQFIFPESARLAKLLSISPMKTDDLPFQPEERIYNICLPVGTIVSLDGQDAEIPPFTVTVNAADGVMEWKDDISIYYNWQGEPCHTCFRADQLVRIAKGVISEKDSTQPEFLRQLESVMSNIFVNSLSVMEYRADLVRQGLPAAMDGVRGETKHLDTVLFREPVEGRNNPNWWKNRKSPLSPFPRCEHQRRYPIRKDGFRHDGMVKVKETVCLKHLGAVIADAAVNALPITMK